jgi:hypothetical protein
MRGALPVLACVLALVPACAAPGIEREPTQNGAVQLELLFTHGGCSVYRFHDGPSTVYYADCEHSASTFHEVSCGRDCVRREVVSTAE